MSPLAHEIMRTLNRWKDVAQKTFTIKSSQYENYVVGNFNLTIESNIYIGNI